MALPLSDRHHSWLHHVQCFLDEHYGHTYKNLKAPRLAFEPGRKYVRVVADNGSQRMVFCFLDRQGGIYKAATWRAPAKHVRGHITDDNDSIGKAITPFGAAYLR